MFKKKETKLNHQPIPKGIYAWLSLRAGDFLVYKETLKDCYSFISLPGPTEMFLTFEDFTKCVKKGMLEFVEQLPDDVYEETINFLLSCPQLDSNVTSNENKK